MTALLPAKLIELDGAGDPVDEFEVQFAPASLSLATTNNTDGGKGSGRQAQQSNGSASTTLSLDLEFDTADEGTTDAPVDVRTLTNEVRRFILPGAPESKQAPPKVQFHWGQFVFSGVMNQLNEEHDLFSPQGVPLRSKLSIQIKEQDPKFEALEAGTGANSDTGAPAAGDPAADADPGSDPNDRKGLDKSVEALDGETPADLLSRMGIDPAAWRGIADALTIDPITFELDPGSVIDFSPTLSLGGNLGSKGGITGGIGVNLDAKLGLSVSASSPSQGASRGAAKQQGFSMASAGGFTAAVNQSATTKALGTTETTRAAFDAPAPPRPARSPAASDGPVSSRPRAVPSRPEVDRRASTFGSGVPLRTRAAVPATRSRATAGTSWTAVGPRAPSPTGPAIASTRRRGLAPWEQLPADDPGRTVADDGESHRHPHCGCHVCHPITKRFQR